MEMLEDGMLQVTPKMPVMIPIPEVELETCEEPASLAFKLGEHSQIFYAPILSGRSGDFEQFRFDEQTGLPVKFNSTYEMTDEELLLPDSGSGFYGIMKDGRRIYANMQDMGRRFEKCKVLLVNE